mmetsp:Transcript_19284/g.55283  ORF Transcript_19284/g.55283 Transcript_19284/m.55283 type:complete len:81 (+) Transcript_19284:2054-2296(+)
MAPLQAMRVGCAHQTSWVRGSPQPHRGRPGDAMARQVDRWTEARRDGGGDERKERTERFLLLVGFIAWLPRFVPGLASDG